MSVDCIYKKYEPLFGSWYITEKIGEGAIAQVYAMERRELGVTYHAALKAITIPSSEDEVKSAMADGMTGADLTHYYETMVQNVVSEFDFMSRLKGHSHIVSYEDHQIIEHEDDIGWDILMRIELLTPLIEHSLEHPLDEADVLRLGIDICKALEYCRQFDILHRDVKPENIFVSPSGGYKLGDFGIARVVEETRIGLSRKGTYTYMAPEVYRGEAYGPSADIYSLGMVMYKYLNDGRNPFMPSFPNQLSVDDYDEAFAKRIAGEPMQEPAYGSRRLKKLILKACAFDPSERYHSPAEFRRDLEQLQGKEKGREDRSEGGSGSSIDPMREDAPKEGAFLHRMPDPSARRRKGKRIALVAALFLFLIAGVIDAFIPDEVTGITGIDNSEVIYIGDQLAPSYKVEPDWFKDEPIDFSIEDEQVASVNRSGQISALAVGKTDLSLTAGDFEREVEIRVVPKVTKIQGVSNKLRLEEGSTKTLSPELSPKKFANEPITFKSGNRSVVTVNKKGRLKAKSPGNAKVTITAGGCKRTISVEVYEYVPPAPVYTPRSSGGSSGSSGSSKSSGSSSSGKKKSGGSSGGYFKSSDDEYF